MDHYKTDCKPINVATCVLYFMISNKIHASAEAIYSSSITGRVFSGRDSRRCQALLGMHKNTCNLCGKKMALLRDKLYLL